MGAGRALTQAKIFTVRARALAFQSLMFGRRVQSQCEQMLCPSWPPISSLLLLCARDSQRSLSKAGLCFFVHFPVLCSACFFQFVLKKEKSKTSSMRLQGGKKILWSFFSILARNTASTVIMVSNKGHGIASSKITTYFSVGEIRPGKTPTEFNRGETDFG